MDPVEEKDEISLILKKLGHNKNQFVQAFHVTHCRTRENYENRLKSLTGTSSNTDLLWHGSRNENWWSIIQNGLMLNPSSAIRTGAMFGCGIYFADKAQKSIGYSSLSGSYWTKGKDKTGFLSLFDVNVGKQMILQKSEHWHSRITEKSIKERGYDSVFAKSNDGFLRNNEFIVYNESQCTTHYIIELKG